jgi:CRP/FNR family cyclic AMP-dependent transcriptional regulator
MKWPPDEVQWIFSIFQQADFFSLDPKQMENYRADIEMLVDSMTKERVKIGEPVIIEGQKGASLYLVRSGRAGVWVHRNGVRLKLASLGSGSCFGEISLLTGEPCTATVVAEVEPMEVYRLKRSLFRAIIKSNPKFAAHIMNLVADRLTERKMGLDALRGRSKSK